jgi:phosphate transport system substrate-binding protein
VVPAYHLSGFKEPITFSGPVLADIYLGKVAKWDDPALQKLNPGVTLPNTPITVVHRSEGSGTAFIWTDYLGKVSPAWKSKPGVGMSVQWPVGVGKAGNAGVAEAIKRTDGAIGYVQLDYAIQDKLAIGLVKNRAGMVVKADHASVTAAARSSLANIPADLRFSMTDAAAADAYPIAGTVWAIVYVKQPAANGKALADFLRWATHEGQASAEKLHYAPLPAELVERVDRKLDQLAAGP